MKMGKIPFWAALWGMITLGALPLQAQRSDPDQGKTIQQIEKELAPIARTILNSDSTELKIEQNKRFVERMTNLLKRPESYNYAFDSLKSISRLRPQDESFRIFTWYLVDGGDGYYAKNAHYYFGLVQRRFVGIDGKVHFLVIPLMELEQIPTGIENMVTDNLAWFGALYYAPKKYPYIRSYDGYYLKLVPKEGEFKAEPGKTADVVTFVPGRYNQRNVTQGQMLNVNTHTRVKQTVRYYTLMGWNGWDDKANYKLVDVLSFDPVDSMKVNFGAPMFYFDNIPKARAVFKYGEFAPFTLNEADVRSGWFKSGKKRMIVFDHLAPPKFVNPTDTWEMGPDGTIDGLSYYKRWGGYFEWYRTVENAEKEGGRRHAKEMAKLQMQYAKQDTLMIPDYREYKKQQGRNQVHRSQKKELDRQSREAQKRIRDAGLELRRNPAAASEGGR
jgi:hypothetical protein